MSGVVSTSSDSITLSKKSMFVLEVTKMSLLERSSGTITTLPRIMPLSASETLVTMLCTVGVVGLGWLFCGGMPGRRRSVPDGWDAMPGRFGWLTWPDFARFDSFSSCFCDSSTIFCIAVCMSVAFAFLIWRTYTFSFTGVATSISLATWRILMMFCWVSVARILPIRS